MAVTAMWRVAQTPTVVLHVHHHVDGRAPPPSSRHFLAASRPLPPPPPRSPKAAARPLRPPPPRSPKVVAALPPPPPPRAVPTSLPPSTRPPDPPSVCPSHVSPPTRGPSLTTVSGLAVVRLACTSTPAPTPLVGVSLDPSVRLSVASSCALPGLSVGSLSSLPPGGTRVQLEPEGHHISSHPNLPPPLMGGRDGFLPSTSFLPPAFDGGHASSYSLPLALPPNDGVAVVS